MSRKAKQDDPAQSRRFIEAAKQAGAEEPSKDFERLFRRIVAPDKPKPTAEKRKR